MEVARPGARETLSDPSLWLFFCLGLGTPETKIRGQVIYLGCGGLRTPNRVVGVRQGNEKAVLWVPLRGGRPGTSGGQVAHTSKLPSRQEGPLG